MHTQRGVVVRYPIRQFDCADACIQLGRSVLVVERSCYVQYDTIRVRLWALPQATLLADRRSIDRRSHLNGISIERGKQSCSGGT